MVKEELSFHQVEGKVMEKPAENGDTDCPIVVAPCRYLIKNYLSMGKLPLL